MTSLKRKKESGELKPKKSTFVPPYGAAITEDCYCEKKKIMEEEKKEKKKEKTEKENQKLVFGKKKRLFSPPFSQKEHSSELKNHKPERDNDRDQNVDRSLNKKAKKKDEDKDNKVGKTEKKGKGPKSNSGRGKGPAKKSKRKPLIEINSECSEVDDTECCVICRKFQPEALNLDQSIRFVDWGCCVVCSKWVHLKFCSVVEKLSASDEFKCPRCSNEQ